MYVPFSLTNEVLYQYIDFLLSREPEATVCPVSFFRLFMASQTSALFSAWNISRTGKSITCDGRPSPRMAVLAAVRVYFFVWFPTLINATTNMADFPITGNSLHNLTISQAFKTLFKRKSSGVLESTSEWCSLSKDGSPVSSGVMWQHFFKCLSKYTRASAVPPLHCLQICLSMFLCNAAPFHTWDLCLWPQHSVFLCWLSQCPGAWFSIKMPSYQYGEYHYEDKTVVRSSYLHNDICYTGKMTSLYWIRALFAK